MIFDIFQEPSRTLFVEVKACDAVDAAYLIWGDDVWRPCGPFIVSFDGYENAIEFLHRTQPS
jgi:hypothetical protein